MADYTIKPVKGSASWSKATGIIQVSGTTGPSAYADDIGIGTVIDVEFEVGVDIDSITVSNITLLSWQCTPTGWVFSGQNILEKDLIGEYLSVFECMAQYKSMIQEMDISEYLETLLTYDESHTRRTSSPYAVPNTGWWRLSEIAPTWTIPELADTYISQLQLLEYTSSLRVVNSSIPLQNQLFLVDAFSKSVSMIPEELREVDTTLQDAAVSDFLDLRNVDGVDMTGNSGNPLNDPRGEDGVGSINIQVKHDGDLTDEDPVANPFTTDLEDKWSSNRWLRDSSRQNNYQRLNLYSKLGSRPTQLPHEVQEWIKDLVVPITHTSLYDQIVSKSFDYNIEYFDRYNVTQDLYKTISHTFVRSHEAINPYAHSSSLPVETFQVITKQSDVVLKGLLAGLGIKETKLTLASLGYDPLAYVWGEDVLTEAEDLDIGVLSPLYIQFDEYGYSSAKVTQTKYIMTPVCEASNGDMSADGGSDTMPYLFEREYNETITYQAGPFLLNLESLFWITPDAADNLGAIDPQGNRVWIGPYDDAKKYSLMIPTMLTMYELFRDEDGRNLHEALCTFAQHGNLLKEADILVAAICDELSKDAPMEYVKMFETYYKTVHNWFDGQFTRMNGLQYSYSGSHSGLGEAIAALANKQGVTTIDSILERILPGSRVADAQDRAGGAYCIDMLEWISENGLLRLAFGADMEPDECEDDDPECDDKTFDKNLARFVDPLVESRSITRFLPGMIRTENYNLKGDVSVSEIPADGHPELVFVQPRTTQVSTIERDVGNEVDDDDEEETLVSHRIESTKIRRWDTIYTLKEHYATRLLGKRLVVVSDNTDYSDDVSALPEELAQCFAEPTIRSFKLTVSPDCNVGLGKSQISVFVEEEE